MNTGVFSVSLSVNDLKASKEFYEKLGFKTFSGGLEFDFLFMKKANSVLRLFQDGILEGNLMTFNPDWTDELQNNSEQVDYSELKANFEKQGIQIMPENTLQEPEGNSFIILDPDGNKILIEQRNL